jgi:branched-chain amino acid transport system substrate-binding protein
MRGMNVTRRAVLGAVLTSLAAGCSRAAGPATAGRPAAPLNVGVIYAGTTYRSGFGAGLALATGNTGQIGTRHIAVTWADDDGDPARAVAAAQDMIAQGCRVLAGGSTDAVSLRLAALAAARQVLYIAGPATADELSGINRYTFRSGRQASQDLLALRAVAGPGRSPLVVAPTAAALTAAQPILGGEGLVAPRKLPSGRDLVIVLPGSWGKAFWQQIVRDNPEVLTFLGPRPSWTEYGTAATGLRFAAYYFDGAETNAAVTAMRAFAPGRRTDMGQPEGFAGAQMVVKALQYGPDDVARMITGLERSRFSTTTGGALEVRASDHALIQPMFQAWLVPSGKRYTAIRAAKFESVAPPAP